ncbi:DNA cytosine methyltransferase [Serratia nevei]|uniref:DNA cytosine methyltransferase n=1 Tax=Serratia nevei TaxID=2703794 RepID=UPI0011C956F8|nr:DNA cytosine methyltransferase [Serratia nevei]TXE72645.1 DNA cytosine methyltransferase [Serratia nevei]
MIKVSDLFAGLGGSSTGAEMAGAEVVWAGNHWPAAVEAHQANHPGANSPRKLRNSPWFYFDEWTWRE